MSAEQSPSHPTDPTGDARRSYAASASAGAELRCQWCFVPLKPGVTMCPTCGSPGVPDPRFGLPEQTPIRDEPALAGMAETPLIAPWRDGIDAQLELDLPAPVARKQMSFQEVENRQARTIIFSVAAVLGCAFLGWLAGPLLAGVIESFTGTPVENTGDLRPMGAFFGLLTGFFIGGVGGVVIWSGR